jgi:hypothetical protein
VSAVQQPGDEPQDELSSEVISGPTVLRMLLGGQLRKLREAAGISPDTAGYEIRASRSKISRVEHGRGRMLNLAKHANSQGWWSRYDDVMPDWFETYVGLEQATSLIRTYELQFVPGLFQTEEYARAVTVLGHRSAPAEEIERRVGLRLQRQQILTRPDATPRVWAVLDESALRRPLGGRTVMSAQLSRLLELTDLPQVTLQVMPFDRGGHSAAGGSFSILRFAEPELPDIVYIEQLTGALYLDRLEEADHYREVMNSLSAEADTPAESARLLRALLNEI